MGADETTSYEPALDLCAGCTHDEHGRTGCEFGAGCNYRAALERHTPADFSLSTYRTDLAHYEQMSRRLERAGRTERARSYARLAVATRRAIARRLEELEHLGPLKP